MEQTDKRKQDKLKFDRVINLARRLPQPAIHDLGPQTPLTTRADTANSGRLLAGRWHGGPGRAPGHERARVLLHKNHLGDGLHAHEITQACS